MFQVQECQLPQTGRVSIYVTEIYDQDRWRVRSCKFCL